MRFKSAFAYANGLQCKVQVGRTNQLWPNILPASGNEFERARLDPVSLDGIAEHCAHMSPIRVPGNHGAPVVKRAVAVLDDVFSGD